MGCRRIFTWIANLLLWGCIVFLVLSYVLEMPTSLNDLGICLLPIFMIIYYCETFICSYCSYFSRLTTVAKSYEDIDKMFRASPLVTMNISCYHYVTRRRGGRGSGSTREKAVTHSAVEEFKYISWRDVSGEFKLGILESKKNESAPYVLLDLSLDVQFSNDGTADDYNQKKEDFVARNKYDRYQDFTRENTIADYQNCFLIQVTDEEPCCFGLGFFIFFGILTFNAFYSTYLDCLCKKQQFTIKKVISTRKNLNAPELQSQYAYYDPRMQVGNQMIVFNPSQGPQVFGLNHVPQQYVVVQQPPPQTLFVSIPQTVEVFQLPEGAAPNLPPNNQSFQTTQGLVYQQPSQFYQGQPQPYPGPSSSVAPYPPQYSPQYPPQYPPQQSPQYPQQYPQQYPPQGLNVQPTNIVPNPQISPQK